MHVCFQRAVLQKEHVLRFTRRIASLEQMRDLLESKEKKKSLVVSGSQTLCKMSWDGDHLDKDIPTPPNKTQVRKQEKHPPTHTELSQDTE